jgi:hypothetical protein
MIHFTIWKEKGKIKVIAPMLPIQNAIHWKDAKDELSIYMRMIPDNARIIEAEYIEKAIKIFEEYEEYEKSRAGR